MKELNTQKSKKNIQILELSGYFYVNKILSNGFILTQEVKPKWMQKSYFGFHRELTEEEKNFFYKQLENVYTSKQKIKITFWFAPKINSYSFFGFIRKVEANENIPNINRKT